MIIRKRNGSDVPYDGQKIIDAVTKANNEVREKDRLLESQIRVIEEKVRLRLEDLDHVAGIEEIQDYVIEAIQQESGYKVATCYTTYRYKRELVRKKNTTDDTILTLVEYENEEVKEENSNKNPMVVSVQRDYMAGEVSRDLTDRLLLPKDITEAHKAGLIHFHDSDYFARLLDDNIGYDYDSSRGEFLVYEILPPQLNRWDGERVKPFPRHDELEKIVWSDIIGFEFRDGKVYLTAPTGYVYKDSPVPDYERAVIVSVDLAIDEDSGITPRWYYFELSE